MTGKLRDALTKEVETRAKLNALAADAQESDRNEAQKTLDAASLEVREALKAEPIDPLVTDPGDGDAEERERQKLTKDARVGDFVAGFLDGGPVEGASAECRSAFGLTGYEIPLPLFEPRRGRQVAETRAATAAPSDTPTEASPVQPYNLQPRRSRIPGRRPGQRRERGSHVSCADDWDPIRDENKRLGSG